MTPDTALFWYQHAGGRYSRGMAGKLLVRVLRRAKHLRDEFSDWPGSNLTDRCPDSGWAGFRAVISLACDGVSEDRPHA
jgi:hypothetical protein